jgi:L,D-transpeptidase catalytic domain
MSSRIRLLSVTLVLVLGAACAQEDGAPQDNELGATDLSLGEQLPDDAKFDGNWGSALTCKTAPNLPRLVNPRITVSLDGLTLHLTDSNGFDKVFPVGVGGQDQDAGSATFGESLSYYPIIAYRKNDFAITPASIQPCKTWWTDPETGAKSPVFAGLPFMSWSGSYAIHGPIDNFRAVNGGTLRRGYVSHGCIRMEAADVLEVYARIKGVASVPVHVQREPERSAAGVKVDLAQKWIGAECQADADCNYAGGLCKQNRFGGRGFCTARCTTTCADRANLPMTFCVADPDDATVGICVSKVTSVNFQCRSSDHLVARDLPRFKQTARASVCVPGTSGWVGDHCFADAECHGGNRCVGAAGGRPGMCTQACDRFCPDEPGKPWTFCAVEAKLGGGACMRECTPMSNASECPASSDCLPRSRVGQSSIVKAVCVPR